MSDVPLHRILVPTDLSEPSLVVLRYARVFAERFSSKLILFYADPIVQPVTPQRLAELDREIRAYAARALEGLPYEVAAAGGHPTPQILREAHDVFADLIVMATHGLRGWRNAVLGSVTEGVLRGGGCPVLSVSRLDERSRVVAGFAKIVCPVNDTPVAREAAAFAEQLAEAFGAKLIQINIAETQDVMPESVAERVLDFAENAGADLLVVGAQHKLFHSIGATTEKIVRFARLPVLTIPRRVETHVEERAEELALKT